MIGQTLGHYRIEAKLGAGGMGEVYRALDTKLGRQVAIKVLAEAFARDPDRLARFEREARALAALNHPNIAAIYGFDKQESLWYLVLEYVPGENLKGPLGLQEALSLGRQIAEALEEAHGKGFVHRDLKPANIKVTPEGKAKLLDFGLAKALAEEPARDPASSPTMTADGTRLGVILGTAAYMSPEQARGQVVDKRVDVWAFGCVLYELLAGRQAFGGESVTDSMAAILTREPDWKALPAGTPAAIERLLRRCLQKDPKQRVHDIADVRLELEEVGTAPGPGGEPATGRGGDWARRRVVWAAAVALAVAVGYGLGRWGGPGPQTQWSGVLLGGPAAAMGPRISPDGQTLAFQAMVDGQTQVAVMKPDSGNWTVLTRERSRGLVSEICWSRDGTKLYFDRVLDVPQGIYSVPVLGGEERLVLEDASGPQALPDGSLVVSRINAERNLQLHRYWPETGRAQPLKALLLPGANVPFRLFPGGQQVVFFGRPLAETGTPNHLYALELTSERIRRLAPGAPIPSSGFLFPMAVEPDGRWVLFDLPAGNLHRIVAAPSDGSGPLQTRLTLTMAPGYLDVGADGSLYIDQWERPGEVLRFPASGRSPERLGVIAASPGALMSLPLPDGRVLATSRLAGRDRLQVLSPGKDAAPFVETQEETSTPAALAGPGQVAFVIGSAPQRTIALASIADGRIVRRLQGAKAPTIDSLAASVDGKTLYYTAAGFVWAIPASDGEPRRLRPGDSVTADPSKQDLIVQLSEKGGVRLVRLPLGGGAERPIPLQGDLRLTPLPLSANAVHKDGRIAVQVIVRDNWFWPAGVLDPVSGRLERIPMAYDADMQSPAWTPDGKLLVVVAQPLRSSLWRFRR